MTEPSDLTRTGKRLRVLNFDLADPASSAATVDPEGPVVLLVAGDVDQLWAADAAAELCHAWSRRGRRIVLADLNLENPQLHTALDVDNLEGVVDIFLYGASLTRIAQPVRDGAFYLIPAGTYASDIDEIYRHPRWRKLVAGFRDTEAALVLFVPADGVDLDAMARWSSEAVLLGRSLQPDVISALQQAGIGVHAVLRPTEELAATMPPVTPRDVDAGETPNAAPADVPVPVMAGAPADAESRPLLGVVRPLEPELELPPPPVRRRAERGNASVLLWIFFLIILMGTAGYLLATLRPDLVPGATPVDQPIQGEGTTSASAPSRLGELLPYSIQVRAFTTLEAAQTEMIGDRDRLGAGIFFISPEEIQGVLYYKILAGLATDTTVAKRLRDRLVETGSVDAEDAVGTWSLLQFTPLAFDLGEFESSAEATEQADSLLVREIPSYAVGVPYSDGSQRWRLYGGAFRDSASASVMRQMLETAGLPARLTARTGMPAILPE